MIIVALTFYFLFPGPSGEQNQEGESMFEIETSTGSSTPVGCGSQSRSGDCPVERTGYAPARRAAGTTNKAGAAVGVDLWVKDTILLPYLLVTKKRVNSLKCDLNVRLLLYYVEDCWFASPKINIREQYL